MHSCVCCIVGLHVWLHCVVSGIIHVTVHFGVSHGCVFWDPTELCIGVGDPRMAGLHLTEIWGAGPHSKADPELGAGAEVMFGSPEPAQPGAGGT